MAVCWQQRNVSTYRLLGSFLKFCREIFLSGYRPSCSMSLSCSFILHCSSPISYLALAALVLSPLTSPSLTPFLLSFGLVRQYCPSYMGFKSSGKTDLLWCHGESRSLRASALSRDSSLSLCAVGGCLPSAKKLFRRLSEHMQIEIIQWAHTGKLHKWSMKALQTK